MAEILHQEHSTTHSLLGSSPMHILGR